MHAGADRGSLGRLGQIRTTSRPRGPQVLYISDSNSEIQFQNSEKILKIVLATHPPATYNELSPPAVSFMSAGLGPSPLRPDHGFRSLKAEEHYLEEYFQGVSVAVTGIFTQAPGGSK